MKTRELHNIIHRLNREIAAIKQKSSAGLFAAGLVVQRDAQRHVPVEYGNLRASAYTRKMPENALAVEIGFNAAYALFVHENIEQKWKGRPRKSGIGVYWGPSGEPRFLANALRRQRETILRLVASGGAQR